MLTLFERALAAHLVADWLLQNDWMALNKSNLRHPAGWAVAGTGGYPGGLHSAQVCLGCGPVPGQLTMLDYYDRCTVCHGNPGVDFLPSGGSSRVSCGACHPAFFDPGGATSCAFCH